MKIILKGAIDWGPNQFQACLIIWSDDHGSDHLWLTIMVKGFSCPLLLCQFTVQWVNLDQKVQFVSKEILKTMCSTLKEKILNSE